MTSNRLREAARVLRERAERTPGGPWFMSEGTHGNPSDGPTYVSVVSSQSGHPVCVGEYSQHDGHAAEYIATVGPDVGLALADWLDRMTRAAHGTSAGDVPFEGDALSIANLILGGESDD